MKIIIKPLGYNEWDLSRTLPHQRKPDIDAHLRLEKGQWTLTVFDAKIKKAEDAYLEDIEINRCPTGPNWNQIIILIADYKK